MTLTIYIIILYICIYRDRERKREWGKEKDKMHEREGGEEFMMMLVSKSKKIGQQSQKLNQEREMKKVELVCGRMNSRMDSE